MAVTTGLQGRIEASVGMTFQKTVNGADGTFPIALGSGLSFTPGTGDGQASVAYLARSATIAGGGAAVTYDMKTSALTGFAGEAISMSYIKAIVLINETAAATPATANLGGNAAEVPYCGAVNDLIHVPAGWSLILAGSNDAGKIAVTQTTGDIIQVANASGSNTLTYSLLVIGIP